MSRNVRRVVTGHDEQGRSVVLADGPVPHLHELPGARFMEVWTTDRAPAPIRAQEAKEPTDRPLRLTSDAGGSVIRIIDIYPSSAGGGQPSPMHRTRTIDYGIVLEGEISMLLPDGVEVSLKAGDIVIQRGTDHAWQNQSDRVARMAFILLDGVFSDELRAKLPEMELTP